MFFTGRIATCSSDASRFHRSYNSPDSNELRRISLSTISDVFAARYGVHTCRTGRMVLLGKNNFQSTHGATRMRRNRKGLVLFPRRQLQIPRGDLGCAFESGRLHDAGLGAQSVEVNGNVRDAKP
jgi:hypothetical protein